MNEKQVLDLLAEFVREKLGVEFSEDMTFNDLEGFNSMLIVELILYLEENLQIEIPEEYYTIDNYTNVSSILNVIQNSPHLQ